MKRILHVIDSLDLGGAQTVILQIAQNLDRERFSMEVASMHGRGFFAERIEKEGIRVHSLSRNKHFPAYIPNFLRLIARNSFDVFHFHLFGSNWIAKPLAAMTGKRNLIAHDHCNDIYRSAKPLNIVIDRLTNRLSRKILAVSHSTKKFLEDVEKIEAGRILYLANGMDTERFRPVAREVREANRKKFALPRDAFVVGGIGRLHPQKNFSLFLEIAAAFRKYPELVFIIAGTGPEEALLKAKARELGLDERVIFAGLVSEMPAFYSCLDVLLLSSRYEGMPMTVLEAMSSGIPVIGARLDGVKEIIADGMDGYLAEPLIAGEFTEKLRHLLENPEKAPSLGIKAREKIQRDFAIQKMVSELETLYLEIDTKY